MTFHEAMDYIEGLKGVPDKHKGRPGSRMAHLRPLLKKFGSEKHGHPGKELSFVLVTGGNGKSSVIRILAEILKAAGYRTGSYITPALFELRDIIQINGRPISKKEFADQMTFLQELCAEFTEEGNEHPSRCEIEMAMALHFFREKECQLILWEIEAEEIPEFISVFPGILTCVSTSGARDYRGLSGKGLMDEPHEKVEREKSSFGIASVLDATGVKRNFQKQVFSCGGYKNLTLSLLGSWQIENGITAIETIEKMREEGFTIPEKAVYKGLSRVSMGSLPGRFQILTKKPYFIADGARDGNSAEKLVETIRFYFPDRKIIFIIGMQQDMEPGEMLRRICPLAGQILTAPTKGERGLSSYELACTVREYYDNVTAVDSAEEAVELAFLLADKETVIVAVGCFSYLGNLIRYVEKISEKKNQNIVGKDVHGIK